MTVVKFSILTLLAGGFCTLLGIGMWMGPQETPCNAQTDAPSVAVAASPAAIQSCWAPAADMTFTIEAAACGASCADDAVACTSADCIAPACAGPACEGGACDLVATPAPGEPSPWPTQPPAPQAVVARLATQGYAVCAPVGSCDSGMCTTSAAPGMPASALAHMGVQYPPQYAPGAPCPPMPSLATTAFYHVAPCTGPECPAPVYSSPYGVAHAYALPAQAPSAYASYQEAEPRTSDQPSMEMIEAFMEEREKRYEAQVEALQAQMELKLEAQEARLKAEHQVEMTRLHAEAFVKIAGMEQALREEKALLALVAEGTLTTDALRSIIAKNHANANGESAQPVSAPVESACTKCDQSEVSVVSAECKCEGDCCPACEQAVSIAAPTCSACKASACEAPVCTTAACAKCEGCKACDAATVTSVGACEACAKTCEACVKACGDCKVAEATLECDALTVSADGKTCTIVVGAKLQDCPAGECKSGKCKACDKSVAVETTSDPFVCEKDGCELQVHVAEVPVLSDIPYLGRLFKNVGISVEKTESVEEER